MNLAGVTIARSRAGDDGTVAVFLRVARDGDGGIATDPTWVVCVLNDGMVTRQEIHTDYSEACAMFFRIANLDPVEPWSSLDYFNTSFREPEPEALIRNGFRVVKRQAGYRGRAVVMMIFDDDQPCGTVLQAAIPRKTAIPISAHDAYHILGLSCVSRHPEMAVVRVYAGDGVDIAFARLISPGQYRPPDR